MQRAAEVLGIGAGNVRSIPIDERRRMIARRAERGDRRRRRRRHDAGRRGRQRRHDADGRGRPDRRAGRHLRSARHLAARRRRLRPAGGGERPATRALFAGLERADSVSVDAHKWLYLPKAAAWCWCATGRAGGDVRARGGVHAPRRRRPERGRPHARVLAAVPRAEALAGLPRARRGRVPRRDRATTSSSPTLRRDRPRAAASWSWSPSRSCRPCCSGTCRRSVADLDAHNLALVEALQRDGRVYLSSADDRRPRLPAAVHRQLPHPPARAGADPGDRRGPGRIRLPGYLIGRPITNPPAGLSRPPHQACWRARA